MRTEKPPFPGPTTRRTLAAAIAAFTHPQSAYLITGRQFQYSTPYGLCGPASPQPPFIRHVSPILRPTKSTQLHGAFPFSTLFSWFPQTSKGQLKRTKLL